MAVKPNARDWTIKEQIIEDLVSGLTLQFEATPESDAKFRLRIFGNLPFGNREILFDVNGAEAGGGTYPGGTCRPSWLQEINIAKEGDHGTETND